MKPAKRTSLYHVTYTYSERRKLAAHAARERAVASMQGVAGWLRKQARRARWAVHHARLRFRKWRDSR